MSQRHTNAPRARVGYTRSATQYQGRIRHTPLLKTDIFEKSAHPSGREKCSVGSQPRVREGGVRVGAREFHSAGSQMGTPSLTVPNIKL